MNELVSAQPEHISSLRLELAHAEERIRTLEKQLLAQMQNNSTTAEKWRERCASLENELKMTLKGRPSACACPVGKCMSLQTDPLQACWMQVAGLSSVRNGLNAQIDAIIRNANHPKRLR
jgi:hypothetical protein